MNLREICAERKGETARLEALPEPELIFGSEPVSIAVQTRDSEHPVFKGLGVSGAVVEGRARVVLDTDALDAFEPGEILVAPHTDAGWTPYFTLASGVIVETGGSADAHLHRGARTRPGGDRECSRLHHHDQPQAICCAWNPGTGEVTVLRRAAGQTRETELV